MTHFCLQGVVVVMRQLGVYESGIYTWLDHQYMPVSVYKSTTNATTFVGIYAAYNDIYIAGVVLPGLYYEQLAVVNRKTGEFKKLTYSFNQSSKLLA